MLVCNYVIDYRFFIRVTQFTIRFFKLLFSSIFQSFPYYSSVMVGLSIAIIPSFILQILNIHQMPSTMPVSEDTIMNTTDTVPSLCKDIFLLKEICHGLD
jgi:hypothetical protein